MPGLVFSSSKVTPDAREDVMDEQFASSSRRKSTLKSTVQSYLGKGTYKPPKEHYPELTGGLIKFITANRELLEKLDNDTLLDFESHVGKVLVPLPEGTSLQTILETFGWDGINFSRDHFTSENIDSLVQSLGKLFSTQIFDGIKGSITSTDINALVSCESLLKDDKMIASFAPDLLFSLLNENATSAATLKSNISLSFKGAVMLADISGFTKLSSQFCEKGSEGLDALHHAASVYLGKFVQVVYLHKGDVVAFAGDALICVFKTESDKAGLEDLYTSCRMATQCALALKEVRMEDLSAHIAVGCGEMNFCSLGGLKNEWAYILNGACIASLSHCIDSAGAREVVVTANVFQQLSEKKDIMTFTYDAVDKTASRDICYKIRSCHNNVAAPLDFSTRFSYLQCTKATMDNVNRFVPRPIIDAIKYGSLDTISELREVTTLFLKLDSYCAVANRDPLTLQGFFFMAQEALFTTGGFLRQFLIDDKGCVLIAMWGVPSFSYVDGRNRAVSCAVEILSGATKLGHSCSAGISTGNIFCGNMGSFARRDFVGIGSTVNLAARLMGKAHGKIFMDESTYKGVPLEFRTLTTQSIGLVLKGFPMLYYPYICDGSVALPVLSGGEKSEFVQKHVSNTIINQVNLANRKKPSGKKNVLKNKSSGSEIDNSGSVSMDEWGGSGSQGRVVGNRMFSRQASSLLRSLTPSAGVETSLVHTVIVRGESGSGKSAVAQLFRNYSTKCQFSVVGVRATDSDKTTPHSVMRKLFIELVGGAGAFKTEEQQRLILTELIECADYNPTTCADPMSVLCAVLALNWTVPPNAFIQPSMKNRTASQKVARAIEDAKLMQLVLHKLFRVLFSQQRRAISIEDAHWCDESSWYGIYLLLSIPVTFPLLITSLSLRTDVLELTTEKSKFGNLAQHVEPLSANMSHAAVIACSSTVIVDICPLDFDEVNELLCHKMNVEHLHPKVVQLAMEVSSGNLFWCREIANFMLKQGESAFLSAVHSQASKSRSNPLSILVTCRLEKLSAESQVVLKLASIVGVEFNLQLLSAVLPFKLISSVDESLSDLVYHHFIFQDSDDLNAFYFGNTLIRTLIYDLTPIRDLTRLHAHVAKKIESIHGANLRPHYETLSYHFSRSGTDGQKCAFKYSVKAADYAIRQGTYNNGLSFATIACKMATTRTELSLLVSVVDRALSDISTKLSEADELFCVMTPQEADGECTYKDLRVKLQETIQQLTVFKLSAAEEESLCATTNTVASSNSESETPFRAFSLRTNELSSIHSHRPVLQHVDEHDFPAAPRSRLPSPRLTWQASYTENMLNDEDVAVESDSKNNSPKDVNESWCVIS